MGYITIIGGIAAEIQGNPYGQLEMEAENPAEISIIYGGTGRNIAENLGRIGAKVAFASAAGDDFAGRNAVRELEELGVAVQYVHTIEGSNTAMNIQVLNIVGELEMAFCNSDIFGQISCDIVDKAMSVMGSSEIVGIDADLPEEIQEYILEKMEKADIPVFMDPVSEAKAKKVIKNIGRFHTIKPDRSEAEVISGRSILSEDELMAAGKWFSEQGVKRIFITLGPGGVYYKEGTEEGIIRPQNIRMVDASGAGDAFSSAVMDGFIQGMNVRDTALYAMEAAAMTLECKGVVHPNINREILLKRMSEKKECE